MAVKTVMMVSNATIQGTPLLMTMKASAPNKTSQVISVMGTVFQKAVFDGENGYEESRGQRREMEGDALEKAKSGNALFEDLGYTAGELVRIEPLEGKNAIVLKYLDKEVFYDMATGLKVKAVETIKAPNGKEVKVPTTFSDYKAVNGILFPHAVGQKSGPMDLNFTISEIKINEGVTDEDFK